MKEMLSMPLDRHFSTSVHIWKSVYQYRKVQTFIWMVKMHTSNLVTSICTLSLFCRFLKHKRNALKDDTSTLFYICSHLEKCISIQESPNICIWMVKMHNSTFVTTISTISLKVFSRFI